MTSEEPMGDAVADENLEDLEASDGDGTDVEGGKVSGNVKYTNITLK